MSNLRIASPSLRLELEPTGPRMTPAPTARSFREALGQTADALLGSAASVLPGGQVVTAAVRGAEGGEGEWGGEVAEAPSPGGGSGMGSLGSGGQGVEGLLRGSADSNMQYLQLQEAISAENRRYSTLSNVLKARHETAKAAINNIR